MADPIFPANRLHLLKAMAPTTNKENHAGEVDDKTLMLKEALKCVKGTLDFEKLANQLNVANGEAM